MSAEIVVREIAGHQVALGLTWHAIEAIDDISGEADEVARREKCTFGAIIASRGMAVVGLAKRRAKAPSAAAWLALASGGEKVALIEPLGGGTFWCCAVKDGLPLPTFDVMGDIEMVVSRVRPLTNDESFKIFAPDGVLPGSDASSFEQLVAGVSPPKNIGVIVRGTSKLVLLAIALVAFGGIGYFYWAGQQKDLAQKSKLMKAQQTAQQTAEKILNEKKQIIDKTRETYEAAKVEFEKKVGGPSPRELASAWVSAAESVELRPAGWRASQLDCSYAAGSAQGACAMTYAREKYGTMGDFSSWAASRGLDAKVDTDRAFLAVAAPQPAVRPQVTLATIANWTQLREQVLNSLQPLSNIGITITIANAPAPKKFTARKEGEKEDLAPPLSLPASIGNWTVSGKNLYEISEVAELMDYPGIQLNSLAIQFNGVSTSWRMEGSYVSKQQ